LREWTRRSFLREFRAPHRHRFEPGKSHRDANAAEEVSTRDPGRLARPRFQMVMAIHRRVVSL
jgi:hypothetical protein